MAVRDRCRWSVIGLAVLLAAAIAPSVRGQCEGWVAGLHYPGGAGLNGSSYSICAWDRDGNGPMEPSIVLGGDFTVAGATPAERVAVWNGETWQSMGAGLSNTVLALAVYNNEVFAGGQFTATGANPVLRIARWDGAAWQPVGAGFDGPVRAMTVYNGQLVVAGSFVSSAALPFNYVARWNGTTWLPLGVGLPGYANALTVFDGSLYAGGAFGVLRWDGASWQPAGESVGGIVHALVVYDSDLHAGGRFSRTVPAVIKNIARLNNGTWQPLGDGLNGPDGDYTVYSLSTFKTFLVAGGDFSTSGALDVSRIARWNGDTWQPLVSGVASGRVFALREFGDDLLVGGEFSIVGGDFSFNWARWTGDGTAPEVTLQPLPLTITRGETANFTVEASSNPGLATYQWRRDGANVMNGPGGASAGGGHVTGAQMAGLTITNAQYGDDGSYSCMVTNECGSVESAAVILSIPCRADFDDDGTVGVPDIFLFLSVWFTGAFPDADFNGDQSVTVADIFAFLAAWFAGCD